MSSAGDRIIAHLSRVNTERAHRHLTPGLAALVDAVKAYQQRRFEASYADFLSNGRYAGAAGFFLRELYGPQDFSRRDAQFLRVVPALIRVFPREVVETVGELAELHELSESLDTRMARQLPSGQTQLGARAYVLAWQACGRPQDRESQITLTIRLGHSLDRLTHKSVLRHTLRMMRGPARAAGLSELQTLLEAGFDAFRAMRGAQEFLATVADRERTIAQALFGLNLERGDCPDDAGVRRAIPSLA